MSPWPREAATLPFDAGPLLDDLRDRFGIPAEAFEGYRFWQRDSGSIWIADAGTIWPAEERVEGVGLQVMRRDPPRGQPSSAFLRRFGSWIRAGRLSLDTTRAAHFLGSTALPVDSDLPDRVWAVECEGQILGRGRTRGGILHSELPKASRRLIEPPIWVKLS